jgi:hypothetical protein
MLILAQLPCQQMAASELRPQSMVAIFSHYADSAGPMNFAGGSGFSSQP